jgi:hypothetical protein
MTYQANLSADHDEVLPGGADHDETAGEHRRSWRSGVPFVMISMAAARRPARFVMISSSNATFRHDQR